MHQTQYQYISTRVHDPMSILIHAHPRAVFGTRLRGLDDLRNFVSRKQDLAIATKASYDMANATVSKIISEVISIRKLASVLREHIRVVSLYMKQHNDNSMEETLQQNETKLRDVLHTMSVTEERLSRKRNDVEDLKKQLRDLDSELVHLRKFLDIKEQEELALNEMAEREVESMKIGQMLMDEETAEKKKVAHKKAKHKKKHASAPEAIGTISDAFDALGVSEASGSGGSLDAASGSGGADSGLGGSPEAPSGPGGAASGSGGSPEAPSGSGSALDAASGSGGALDAASGSGGALDAPSGSDDALDAASGSDDALDAASVSDAALDTQNATELPNCYWEGIRADLTFISVHRFTIEWKLGNRVHAYTDWTSQMMSAGGIVQKALTDKTTSWHLEKLRSHKTSFIALLIFVRNIDQHAVLTLDQVEKCELLKEVAAIFPAFTKQVTIAATAV